MPWETRRPILAAFQAATLCHIGENAGALPHSAEPRRGPGAEPPALRLAQGSGTVRRSTDRSGDRPQAIGRELRLDGRPPAGSVFKDQRFPSPLASLDDSSRGQIFLRRRRAGRPRQRGKKGRLAGLRHRLAGVSDPPAGISDPPAGVSDPLAGVSDPLAGVSEPLAGVCEPLAGTGEPLADTGEPLAGVSEPLAGTGEPVADSGEPLAGAGRTMKDTGRRIGDVNRSMRDAGQSMRDAGQSMRDAGRSITDAGETSFNRETWTLEASAPYACFEVDSAAPRISGSEAAACSLTNDVNDVEDGRLGRRRLSLSFFVELHRTSTQRIASTLKTSL